MPQNFFSPKVHGKSSQELKSILDHENSSEEIKEAAKLELAIRESPEKQPGYKGEWQYEAFLSDLKNSGTLVNEKTYQEILSTTLDHPTVLQLGKAVFEKLEWIIVQEDKEFVLALRTNTMRTYREMVSFLISPAGELIVFSQTHDSPRLKRKNTRNMEAVKLAIHVFNELADDQK